MEHKYVIEKGDLVITSTPSNEEIQTLIRKANVFLASQVTIKGFRKGKAPLEIASKYVNPNDLDERVSRKLIDLAFKDYIADTEIRKILDNELANGVYPSISFPKTNKGETAKVEFKYALKPQIVKLGNYKGLKTDATKVEIDDKAIENELNRLANDIADLIPVEEEAISGDYVNVDLKGSINGIEMPELSEKALDIVIGSKKFIPGFEDQLLNHKAGDDFIIDSDLPDNYPENIAGKKASFKVHVNSIKRKEVPAIDDSFVTLQEQYKDVKTLDELKEKIKETLVKRSDDNYRNARLNSLIEQIVSNSEFVVDDNLLKSNLVSFQREEDEKTLSQQGLDLKTYLRLTNMPEETYANNVYNNLISSFKVEAVEKMIAKENSLVVKDEEIKAEALKQGIPDFDKLKAQLISNYKTQYPNADEFEVNEYVDKTLEPISKRILVNKVFDFILDNNN